MRQRARQRQQVEHHRSFAQRIDVGRTECVIAACQLGDDVQQVAAPLHEDRDLARGGFLEPRRGYVRDCACLAQAARGMKGVYPALLHP